MTSGLFSTEVLVFILRTIDELGDMVLTKRHEGLVCGGNINILSHDGQALSCLER